MPKARDKRRGRIPSSLINGHAAAYSSCCLISGKRDAIHKIIYREKRGGSRPRLSLEQSSISFLSETEAKKKLLLRCFLRPFRQLSQKRIRRRWSFDIALQRLV